MPPEPLTPSDAELRTALHEPARPEFLAALDDRILDAIDAERAREPTASPRGRRRFGLPRFAAPALGVGALAAIVVAVVLATGGSSTPAPGLRASAHPSAPASAAQSAPAAAGGTGSSGSSSGKGEVATVAPLRVLPTAGPGEIHLGYTVITPGRLHVTLRRLGSGPLLRRSVALDPGTGTVVLRLTHAPAGRYRLRATGVLALRATVRVR